MDTRGGTDGKQRVTKFAAVAGRWNFEDRRAVFIGPENSNFPFGICATNIRFLEGEAEVTVHLTQGMVESRILFGYRSQDHEYYSVGLGGAGGKAYAVVHFNPTVGWRPLAGAGLAENLPTGRPIKLLVRVRGQRISLEVDDVRVFEYVLPAPLPYGQLGLFTWGGIGPVEFTDFSVRAERGDAFVVMQFSGFEELYTDVIEPLTKEFGLRPYRADQVYGPGSVIHDIIKGIETAQIVIAEITPINENVFYEVGYAHGVKKPTILLADTDKKLPFDLSGYRCLFYQNSIGGKRKVEEGLRKHLQAILDE